MSEDFSQYNGATCNIFRCYHDASLKTTNASDDERVNIINYYSKANYPGTCYNYLELIFNEVVCIIYPYLNNIKSQYIGFQHYRRAFYTKSIDFSLLDNNVYFFNAAPWYGLERQLKSVWYLTDDMYDVVYRFLNLYYPQLIDFQKDKKFFVQRNIFLTSYDLYCDIAQFYIKYIVYIMKAFGLGFDQQKWKHKIYNMYVLPNKNRHMWYTQTFFEEDIDKNHPYIFRIWSYVLECLAGEYILYRFNTIYDQTLNYNPTQQVFLNPSTTL